MSQTDSPRFIADCPACEIDASGDDYDEVMRAVSKHEEHTGHQMKLQKFDFDFDLGEFEAWSVRCETCENEWSFDTEEEAEQHIREHSTWTDHEIENDPQQEEYVWFENSEQRHGNIKQVIATLESHHEEGAPEEMVAQVLTDEGMDHSKIRSEIEKLRKKGEVYEPRTGHLRTT